MIYRVCFIEKGYKIYNESRIASNSLIEVRNAEILFLSSQFLLRSWVSYVMKTFGSLASSGNIVLLFALGIGLTVFFACICFDFIVVSIGFWCMAGSIILWVRLLIFILSLKVTNLNISGLSLESDNWTLLNVSFYSKSDKEEYTFIIVFLKICKSLTLITLICSLIWTL